MATPEELRRLQVSAGYDSNPTLRNAQATQDAAMQRLVTGGRAAAMQAQYDQPVYGPRNAPAQPAGRAPVMGGLAAASMQRPQRPLGDTTGVQQVQPLASPGYSADPADRRLEAAQDALMQRRALASVNPASTLSPENQAVIARDRANLAAAIPPAGEVGQVPMPINQGPTYANERGNYSMTGTSPDVIADARRRADTGSGGVNFGFAPGEARSYLDKMAGQDAAKAAQQAERRQAIADDVERIGLRNAMTQGAPQERRAARQALEALDQRAALTMQQTGETTRAGMGLAAELQRAQTTAGANLAAAQATAAGRLQAAELEGQYGLQAAMAKADAQLAAEVAKGVTPQAELAARRAQLIEQQMILAGQAQEAGDIPGTYAALGLSRPQAPQVYTNPITGAPLSPQEIEMLQRQNIGMLTQPQ